MNGRTAFFLRMQKTECVLMKRWLELAAYEKDGDEFTEAI